MSRISSWFLSDTEIDRCLERLQEQACSRMEATVFERHAHLINTKNFSREA